MKYLDAFRAKAVARGFVGFVGAPPLTSSEFPEEKEVVYISSINNHMRDSGNSYPHPPTKPTEPPFVGFVGSRDAIDSAKWSRPAELPSWPLIRREQWGIRANQLQDEGVPWPDHERQAFFEIKDRMIASGGPRSAPT